MLGFVTSLRHPVNSNDYGEVERLLAETVASWRRQGDDRWCGVVVGNVRPTAPLPDGVRFIPVDFPPPSPVPGPMTGIPAVLRDKGTKLAVGLGAARELGAGHVMFVDADDLVSRRLAGWVADRTDEPGWTVTHGWRWNAARRAVRAHVGDFHLQCGSSHIVRTDLYPHPHLDETASQAELYAAYGDKLERWIGSHMHVHDDLPLADLPFPGALYRVGSGEAHSGNSMGGWARPVGRSIARDFGAEPTGWSPWRLAAAVTPSRQAVAARLGISPPCAGRRSP